MNPTCTLTLALLAAVLAGGCQNQRIPRVSPYAPLAEVDRDPREAQRLTQRAAALVHSDPDEAESLLRRALAADLYHGPAHNNLGVIHLGKGDLYEAAHEFEWARKLMPGHPDPRLNLGLALEKAGRIDSALETYHTALAVYPGHLPTIQALARCQLRHGRPDDETDAMLEDIALRGDVEWREWARLRLAQRSN